MILTNKQQEGIRIAKERFKNNEEYTCISGFAGSGKSTLVKFLISELGIPSSKIAYACFTGKASLVLQQKGLTGAMTLHKLLYKSFKNKDGSFVHVPKDELDIDCELIVIDEISMCPANIWREALKHGIHIIALGDPFQLPPIGEDNGILANPHVFLDEVMRQALESDIIKLSMDIRNGKPLMPMNGNDVKVIRRDQLVTGMYEWADQILCGKNATRRLINAQVRQLKNRGKDPEVGDKVICLKNYWDISNEQGDPLINGMIGELVQVKLSPDEGILDRSMTASFMPDFAETEAVMDGVVRDQKMDYRLFTEGIPTPEPKDIPYWKRKKLPPAPLQFDYGYAITVHKSQGSQFNNVLLFEEKMNREMHARWLYTAITRAVDKIVIVMQ